MATYGLDANEYADANRTVSTFNNVLRRSSSHRQLVNTDSGSNSSTSPKSKYDIELGTVEHNEHNEHNNSSSQTDVSFKSYTNNNYTEMINYCCTYYFPFNIFSTYEKRKYFMAKVINLYIHFVMITTFVMLFYFHYIVQSEKALIYQMIREEEKNLMEFTNTDPSKYYDNPYYDQMCSALVDGRMNKQNAEIYNKAMYLVIGMLGFMVCLIMFEIKVFKYSSFPAEFGWALVLLILVGSFDYNFFNIVVKNYNVIDTPEIICDLYEEHQS